MPFFERLVAIGQKVSPYFMVAAIFTAVYMFVPNTKVKWKPALIGGVTAGILWAAVGQLFTAMVLYSTRLTVVYAGFAIIVAALLWTYFGWLILLVGAQLSFYVQNRNYLRMGLTELRMSAVQREQLTLKIMYLIGRAYHDGKTRWTVDGLSHHLEHARHRHLAPGARARECAPRHAHRRRAPAAGARPRPDLDSGNHRHRAQ